MLSLLKKKDRESTDSLIYNTEFTVIDTELTGLNIMKDQIIAIGAIKMKGKTIKVGEIFYRTVKPDSDVKRESIMIHEITPSELNKSPEITPILREFLVFIRNSIIVGHFVSIDLDFLRKEINKNLRINLQFQSVDTLMLYKWLIISGVLPESFSKNISLKDVSLSLNIKPEKIHNAIADAFITAQIFQRLLVYLSDIKITTIKQLLKLGNPNALSHVIGRERLCYQL